MSIQHKNLSVAQFKVVDKTEGICEMIVSVFSNVDGANERIMPKAFVDSLATKLPKGVWAHDWTVPVAKTLEAKELLPGDPTLPEDIRALGGLYVKGQFNLDTQRGREAFSDLAFGSIDEFSIGYLVEKSNVARDGVRDLTKLRLYEWSPVLVGCNDQTSLIGTKTMKHFKTASMPGVELDMTRSAINQLVDTLCYDVLYEAIYGCYSYDDDADAYLMIPGATPAAIETVSEALDEFKALTLAVMTAMFALAPSASVTQAKQLRVDFADPQLGGPRAGQTLAKHSEQVLAAIEELSTRAIAVKAMRERDGRAVSEATAERLSAVRLKLSAVCAAMGELAHTKTATIHELRVAMLTNQVVLNALTLGD